MEQSIMPTIQELSRQGAQLTEEHLREMVKDAIKANVVGEPPNTSLMVYTLSLEVLIYFLGFPWVDANVLWLNPPLDGRSAAGRKYFSTHAKDDPKRIRYQIRVTQLAQNLFNLQHIDGFKQRLLLMRTSNIESAAGEMEGAALLATPNLKFRFITPTGVKGQDYEGEFSTHAGRVIACEIKVKAEKTKLTLKSVWGTLEEARQQLPKDRPGAIFLKVPDTWVDESSTEPLIGAFEKIFRQSNRVINITLLWEEWYTILDDRRVLAARFRTFPNPRSKFYEADVEMLFQSFGMLRNEMWLDFRLLIERLKQE
jgi:hypothetical protein